MNGESSFRDPAEAMRLIEHEQANIERRLTPDPRLMYWPWGLAWLLGFGLFFLTTGAGRNLLDLPGWFPPTALTGLMMTAGIITGVTGARSGRQVAGRSARQGRMYGITWSVAFAGLALLFGQFGDTLPEARLNLLWGGGMVALTGALFMAGGAIWNDRDIFRLGLWTSLVNAVGVLLGTDWHALVVAVGAGGGMLLTGLVGWLRLR